MIIVAYVNMHVSSIVYVIIVAYVNMQLFLTGQRMPPSAVSSKCKLRLRVPQLDTENLGASHKHGRKVSSGT